jgi:gamma-glutamyltranspeptidase / glutathione hydrolase
MKKLSLAFIAVALVASPIQAQGNAVASSADPRVTEAGAEILRQGGSASDAAMAMMLALTVVEPQSSGIGGGGFLLHHDKASGTISTINGRETAPAAATPERFLTADGKPMGFLQAFQGGKSVGVPGNIALMAEAHKKWGKLKWAKLFQPAIRLAEKGFVVNKTLESRLATIAPLWGSFDAARALYWQGGKPVTMGTTLKNPALAATLKRIARTGPDAFYKGAIAGQIVDAVNGSKLAPGDMTMSDLAAYRAKEQNAVCAPYRVYVIAAWLRLRRGRRRCCRFWARSNVSILRRAARTMRKAGT